MGVLNLIFLLLNLFLLLLNLPFLLLNLLFLLLNLLFLFLHLNLLFLLLNLHLISSLDHRQFLFHSIIMFLLFFIKKISPELAEVENIICSVLSLLLSYTGIARKATKN
uniref:Uncharacterized protein n=1 Tax=Cacopsylla melanoneura TaxID=428564 RepID=A0A8D8LUH9_9HEMI